jgi:hypothetical protein
MELPVLVLPRSSGFRASTDGPHVPDIFAARPVRKAVLEKREAKEEAKTGR